MPETKTTLLMSDDPTLSTRGERLPWEDSDLTSDEDVVTDTLTPERLERLRGLADRFAASPQS